MNVNARVIDAIAIPGAIITHGWALIADLPSKIIFPQLTGNGALKSVTVLHSPAMS